MYAIGDVRVGAIGRVGVAVGEGQMALRNAYTYLDKHKTEPSEATVTKAQSGKGLLQFVAPLFVLDRENPYLGQTIENDDAVAKYSPDEARDESGKWTDGGGGLVFAQHLAPEAVSSRDKEFVSKYGPAVHDEVKRLAADWYTMRPTSHLDAYLKGTLPDGQEKSAWAAESNDTQARLAAAPTDHIDLNRGIPGKEIADAVEKAKASGATTVEIPIHDSNNHTHEAVSATGERSLAADYATRRWERHGGDPADAHTGVVLHLRVPKSDVVFATPFSNFTNPYTKDWNEFLVRTHGTPSIKLPISDVQVLR